MDKKAGGYHDKTNSFILNVNSSKSIAEFKSKIVNNITSVIDTGNSVVILDFDKNGNSLISGSAGIDAKWLELYNNYYNKISSVPDINSKNIVSRKKEWNNYPENEYFRDFLTPQGINCSACAVFLNSNGKPANSLIINRSLNDKPFDEYELNALAQIEAHLNNHYKLLEIIEDFKTIQVLKPETEIENDLLSPRQSEIISMLIKRQKPPEIAENLSISILTVRKHIQNIYEKLAVTNRHDLLNKIRK
jgi:DNA-binding CsgD family transcriptional regulator